MASEPNKLINLRLDVLLASHMLPMDS